jgi:aspartyl-tRNA(Asn)/glutamyl-tRNA(Gln) amidotransferase subunit C
MQIDHKTVDQIAHLARLEFNNEAKDQMVADMNNMLKFVEKLNELDTNNVEPLIYMSDEVNVFRKDAVIHDITQQEALLNAPKHDSDYFKAPKVMEQ